MTDDDLNRDEKGLFQYMADGVIESIGKIDTGIDRTVRYAVMVRLPDSPIIKPTYSSISALDAYMKAVGLITAAALEGKQIYSEAARKRRARLGL